MQTNAKRTGATMTIEHGWTFTLDSVSEMVRFLTVIALLITALSNGAYIGWACADGVGRHSAEPAAPECCKDGMCPAHRGEGAFCPMHHERAKDQASCGMSSYGEELVLLALLAPALIEGAAAVPLAASIEPLPLPAVDSENNPDLYPRTPPPKVCC
jgi:hypothetical protein